MRRKLGGWPLIVGSIGLVMGLVIGSSVASMFDFMLFSGPTGPAVGGVLGVAVGLYLERGANLVAG